MGASPETKYKRSKNAFAVTTAHSTTIYTYFQPERKLKGSWDSLRRETGHAHAHTHAQAHVHSLKHADRIHDRRMILAGTESGLSNAGFASAGISVPGFFLVCVLGFFFCGVPSFQSVPGFLCRCAGVFVCEKSIFSDTCAGNTDSSGSDVLFPGLNCCFFQDQKSFFVRIRCPFFQDRKPFFRIGCLFFQESDVPFSGSDVCFFLDQKYFSFRISRLFWKIGCLFSRIGWLVGAVYSAAPIWECLWSFKKLMFSICPYLNLKMICEIWDLVIETW